MYSSTGLKTPLQIIKELDELSGNPALGGAAEVKLPGLVRLLPVLIPGTNMTLKGLLTKF